MDFIAVNMQKLRAASEYNFSRLRFEMMRQARHILPINHQQ
jgi:hypothetical protein